MTSIDAGHYKCPCCRTALKATELPQHIIAEREEDAAEVAVTLSQPGQVTEEMINNLYAETLAPYVWHRVANGNRCHYAAWSSVYTSMLTLQAAARGFLTRRRLRVAPAPAPAS